MVRATANCFVISVTITLLLQSITTQTCIKKIINFFFFKSEEGTKSVSMKLNKLHNCTECETMSLFVLTVDI